MDVCGLPQRTDSSRAICLLVTVVQRTTNIKSWDVSKEILVYPRSEKFPSSSTQRPSGWWLHLFFSLVAEDKCIWTLFDLYPWHGWKLLLWDPLLIFIRSVLEFYCLFRCFPLLPPPFSPSPFLPAAVPVPPQCISSKILYLYSQHFSVHDCSLEETILIAFEW